MKGINVFLLLIFTGVLAFGQDTYRLKKWMYKSNSAVVDFKLFKDSSCFLYDYIDDYATYSLFKGNLTKLNDTLYEFKFQPVVSFGGSMGINKDSVTFRLHQFDTIITSFKYQIKTTNGFWRSIDFIEDFKTTFIKDIKKQDYLMNTKFVDPITKDSIFLKIDTRSDPYLAYYGHTTRFFVAQISIVNNTLRIYPNEAFSWYKHTLTLGKK